jgi:hypothetical protein
MKCPRCGAEMKAIEHGSFEPGNPERPTEPAADTPPPEHTTEMTQKCPRCGAEVS